MSNLSPRALALSQAHGPGPVDWERLVAVVDRAVEMSQPAWQPIETAPKGGKPVLLIGKYPTGRGWSDIYQCWWDAHQGGRRSGGWARWTNNFPPTHWMPIPATPADREKTEGEARRG